MLISLVIERSLLNPEVGLPPSACMKDDSETRKLKVAGAFVNPFLCPRPGGGLQERDAEAGLVQYLLSLHGPSDHASTPGAAHTTGPGAAVRTACSAAWRHWTELGARVGDPGLLGTLEVVAEVLGGGRGQGPQSKKQVAPRPCLVSISTRPSVLEAPVSASVPFKSGPQCPLRACRGRVFIGK
ncbi:hypothetical protein PAL_GLEAN10010386 [Pteropus alecto]|uniref:Uncharacterized protein n=1 Tax=Pteropus alecto TaxID=9402 RepID=L5KJC1_PTEAL|nr:hypothetical protein PAL_GLEAN10010386 [Pteropus alecto]